jgi:hypothetical protein
MLYERARQEIIETKIIVTDSKIFVALISPKPMVNIILIDQ